MNIVRIENLSSCDFTCVGSKLRVKRSSLVINSTAQAIPNPYNAIVGTVPADLKENATVIEVFSNAVAYWTQTSCDPTSYTWSTPIVVERSDDDIITTFINTTFEGVRTIGSQPNVNVTLPSTPSTGDTLVIKYANCMSGFYTFNGTIWELDFWQEDCYPSTTFTSRAGGYTGVPATDQPVSPGVYTGDTQIIRYGNATRRGVYGFWTWNGGSWDLNYVLDTMGMTNTHIDDTANPAPAVNTIPGTGFPTVSTEGDTAVRKFSDYMVWYTYNGTAWEEDFRCLCNIDLEGFDCEALVP